MTSYWQNQYLVMLLILSCVKVLIASVCDSSSLVNVYADESTQTLSYLGGSIRRGSTNCYHYRITSSPFDNIEIVLLGVTFYGDGCLTVLDGLNGSSSSVLIRQECSNITSRQVPTYLTNPYSYIKFYPGGNVIEGSFRLSYKTKVKTSYGNSFSSKDSSAAVLAVLSILILVVILVGCITLCCKQIRSKGSKDPKPNKHRTEPVQSISVNIL